jgi:hypothetical protein
MGMKEWKRIDLGICTSLEMRRTAKRDNRRNRRDQDVDRREVRLQNEKGAGGYEAIQDDRRVSP